MPDSLECVVHISEVVLSRKPQKLLRFRCSLVVGGAICVLFPHAPAFSIFTPFDGPDIAFEAPHAPGSSILTPFEGPDIGFAEEFDALEVDCVEAVVGEGESEGRFSGIMLTTGACAGTVLS